MGSVLVVGGGIGGMATAMRLKEAGWHVELVDVDPQWRVYGAGITITGTTLRAYQRLGLLEEIRQKGALTNGARLFTYQGKLLQDLDEPPLEEGLPVTGGIMRPVLHAIMQRQIKARQIPVRLGLTVNKLQTDQTSVSATFNDGTTASYDLLVGADGIFSGVRKLAFPDMLSPVFTGQGCWRITSPRPPGFSRGEFYLGHKSSAGITACSATEVYMWVLTEDKDRVRIPDSEMHDRLRGHLSDFGGNIARLRDGMTKSTWINYRPLEAALQPQPWHVGRIALVGDACHATTPHLASGAGMAVESAIAFSDEISVAGRTIQDGLIAYTNRRYERCKMVVETSVAVGALQLSGGSPESIGRMISGAMHKLAEPF